MVSWPCAVPVPESETLKVEFDPLDATVMSPVALAADCGVNTALEGHTCAGTEDERPNSARSC